MQEEWNLPASCSSELTKFFHDIAHILAAEISTTGPQQARNIALPFASAYRLAHQDLDIV